MKISIIDKFNLGTVIEEISVNNLDDLGKIILDGNYSLNVFSEQKRSKANFKETWFIGLDIDGGLPINIAKSVLNKFNKLALLAPTRNHQKTKNGIKEDRYRIVFQLDDRENSGKSLVEKMKILSLIFPEADSACFDPARLFYPSTSFEIINPKENERPFNLKNRKFKPY